MKSLRVILAAGACVTAGALFGPTLATATVDKMKEVIVKNEDPIPVDVKNSPTVTVSNTPTVTVGNTPTVTVGNTPSVRVDNVPTVAEAGTPVQFRGEFVFFGARHDFTEPYTVPGGKRLRIDQITFDDDNQEAVVEFLSINTVVDGVFARHRVAVSSHGPNGDFATERVSLYADPKTEVRFFVELDRKIGDETTGLHMIPTFAGVLLDA